MGQRVMGDSRVTVTITVGAESGILGDKINMPAIQPGMGLYPGSLCDK